MKTISQTPVAAFLKKTAPRYFVAAAALSVALLSAANFAQTNSTDTGSEAADTQASEIFPVVDTNGDKADLNTYLKDGKWTLVKLWATWCHVCEEQKPVISALHDKHVNDDLLSVVGIALDGKEKAKLVSDNLKDHPATFENLVTDLDDVFAFNYGQLTGEDFYGTPTYLLFNPAGEIAANRSGMIEAGDIERFIANSSTVQ